MTSAGAQGDAPKLNCRGVVSALQQDCRRDGHGASAASAGLADSAVVQDADEAPQTKITVRNYLQGQIPTTGRTQTGVRGAFSRAGRHR